MGFSKILGEAEVHAFPETPEKQISIVREKHGKTQAFQIYGFLKYLGEAEIHKFLTTWEKWISIVRKKYGKTQTFQIYGFLRYFGWNRNLQSSQNMGKVNSNKMGKSMGEHKYSKVTDFLNILGEPEIHKIPKIWEKWIPIIEEEYGKKANILKL